MKSALKEHTKAKCKCSDQVHHEKLRNHGTITGYDHHRCRCDKCVEAKRLYQRIYYRRVQADDPAFIEKTRENARLYRAEHKGGVLLSQRESQREYYQRNKDHIKRQQKKYYDKQVNAVPNPRRGKWSTAEDKVLLNLPPEVGNLEAAFILQRTFNAVRKRRRILLYPPRMCHCGELRVQGQSLCREHDNEYKRKRYAARKAQQTTES